MVPKRRLLCFVSSHIKSVAEFCETLPMTVKVCSAPSLHAAAGRRGWEGLDYRTEQFADAGSDTQGDRAPEGDAENSLTYV